MTPELRSEIEKTTREEKSAGRSTSRRRIAQLLQNRGLNVSDGMVGNAQSKMQDYTPSKTGPKTKTTANINAVEKATLERHNAGKSTSAKIISNELKERGIKIGHALVRDIQRKMVVDGKIQKGFSENSGLQKDLRTIRDKLKGFIKRSDTEKAAKALELRNRLNSDFSLSQNKSFIAEVEAIKDIGARPKEENPLRKSEQRRVTITRQTPMWALRPAYQVELAATGDDVSRGKSQKNVNIKEIFRDKFESDHIRRLADRGLHAPFNIQSLTKEQHNIKRGLENRGLLDRARTLFQHNQYGVHPNVRPLLAENLLEYNPNTGKPFQYLMPDNKSNRARVGSAPMRINITGFPTVGSNLIGVKRRKTIGETLADLLM